MTTTATDSSRLAGVRFDIATVFAEALGDDGIAGYRGLILAGREPLSDPACRVVDLARGEPVDRSRVTVVDHGTLARQGVALARYPALQPGPSGRTARNTLRTTLIREERRALAAAVLWCEDFLSSRRVGTQPLSANPVVAHELAAAVAAAVALAQADPAAVLDRAAGRQWLITQIDQLTGRLIKLAGGRAMLAGHMVQLRTLLLMTNRIYLQE